MSGADKVVQEGILDSASAVFGMHVVSLSKEFSHMFHNEYLVLLYGAAGELKEFLHYCWHKTCFTDLLLLSHSKPDMLHLLEVARCCQMQHFVL